MVRECERPRRNKARGANASSNTANVQHNSSLKNSHDFKPQPISNEAGSVSSESTKLDIAAIVAATIRALTDSDEPGAVGSVAMLSNTVNEEINYEEYMLLDSGATHYIRSTEDPTKNEF